MGLGVAWKAYNAIKEGKGRKYFERLLSLHVLNDAGIGGRPSLTEQDNRAIKEAFNNNKVNHEIPDIIFLLANCLKICSEVICKSAGSIIGRYLHNKNVKSDILFQEAFISWNGSPIHHAAHFLKKSLARHSNGDW